MQPERQHLAVPWPAIGGLSGAALMMLGSFLSWFEISTALQTTTTSGLDSGDGKIVVILAFAIATISGAVLAGIPLPALVGKLAAVLGLIGFVIVALAFLDYSDRAEEVRDTFIDAAVGSGLYVAGLGALVAIASGAVMTPGRHVPAASEPREPTAP